MANLKNTNIDDNLELPQGTTAQRPSSPQEGQIRYNTDLETAEFYNGENWRPLSDTHPEATGGTVVDTDIGGVPYRIHLFTETGTDTLTVTNPGEVEYLIVAGGGGGGNSGSGGGGGGGGAGGLLTGFTTVTNQAYTIIIGAGGIGKPFSAQSDNGEDSSAFGFTAIGGGGGGRNNGSSGGSGAGASMTATPARSGGTGVLGQGNDGGDTEGGISGGRRSGAGGGGAGQAGQDSFELICGDGGIGVSSLITGINQFYAGGGGGGGFGTLGKGGLGGGADGKRGTPGFSGTPNTGGGGGGPGASTSTGGNGGSGIVIVRYPRNSSLDTEPDETRPSFQPFFYARDVRPIIARDGLVLELDAANPLSYPGTGTTWTDLSGNGNDGTLINGVGYTSQNFGSLTFNGVDNTALYSVGGFTPFDDFTLEIIFKINVFSEGLFLGAGHAANGPYGWEVRQNGTTRFGSRPDSGGSTKTVNFSPTSNRVYHGKGVHNGSSGTMTMFIDGNLIGTTTIDQNAGSYGNGTIGTQSGQRLGGSGSASIPFNGNIYSVKIYNRALSAEEVQQNFNATRSRYGI